MQTALEPADPASPPDPASPASPLTVDPARAAELRRQLRGLALALFSWTAADPADLARSTATERLMARAIRPWLPKLRDALLSRLDSTDPAALEAMLGATATALESILYYAPGEPVERFVWRFHANGGVELVPAGAPFTGDMDDTPDVVGG